MASYRTGTGADQTAAGLLEILAPLLAIPTPNPPGNEAATADVLDQLFAPFGVPTRRVALGPGRESLVVVLPGRCIEAVALCGHLDTVPAVAKRWTYPPYGVAIEGDRVYGLGTADMKGGVACIVGAALALLETDTKTDHTVVLAFTADEEGDMGGARSLVHAGVFAQTKFLVVAEPTDGQVYVGEKGQLWLRVAFTGQATHGATPSLGRNAALAAADLALRLEELATTSDFGEGTTFNVGRLTGGERVNAVPEHAELDLDVRFADPLVGSTVLREVRRVVRAVKATRQVVAAVAVLRHLPPLRTDATNAYVRALTAAADAAFGRRTQAELAPYATDAKVIVPPTRVPFAVFGPGCITRAHGPDEYVSLPSLVRTETALATFLRGL